MKKAQKLLSLINWKYVAIYSCVVLVTGLILLVLNVTSEKHRSLFFALGGTCIFVGSGLILLSCCFFDEFKGVELTQANDLANVQCENGLQNNCNFSSNNSTSSPTTLSLSSGSPTSIYKPSIAGSWSPSGPRSPTLHNVSFLTVPEEVFGFEHLNQSTAIDSISAEQLNQVNQLANKPNSAGALSLQSNPRPSLTIALPRVSV